MSTCRKFYSDPSQQPAGRNTDHEEQQADIHQMEQDVVVWLRFQEQLLAKHRNQQGSVDNYTGSYRYPGFRRQYRKGNHCHRQCSYPWQKNPLETSLRQSVEQVRGDTGCIVMLVAKNNQQEMGYLPEEKKRHQQRKSRRKNLPVCSEPADTGRYRSTERAGKYSPQRESLEACVDEIVADNANKSREKSLAVSEQKQTCKTSRQQQCRLQ